MFIFFQNASYRKSRIFHGSSVKPCVSVNFPQILSNYDVHEAKTISKHSNSWWKLLSKNLKWMNKLCWIKNAGQYDSESTNCYLTVVDFWSVPIIREHPRNIYLGIFLIPKVLFVLSRFFYWINGSLMYNLCLIYVRRYELLSLIHISEPTRPY